MQRPLVQSQYHTQKIENLLFCRTLLSTQPTVYFLNYRVNFTVGLGVEIITGVKKSIPYHHQIKPTVQVVLNTWQKRVSGIHSDFFSRLRWSSQEQYLEIPLTSSLFLQLKIVLKIQYRKCLALTSFQPLQAWANFVNFKYGSEF